MSKDKKFLPNPFVSELRAVQNISPNDISKEERKANAIADLETLCEIERIAYGDLVALNATPTDSMRAMGKVEHDIARERAAIAHHAANHEYTVALQAFIKEFN